MKEHDTTWDFIKGWGFRSVRAWLRSVWAGVSLHSLDKEKMRQAAWHEATTLRGYHGMGTEFVMSAETYRRREAQRILCVERLALESHYDGRIPLMTAREYYGANYDHKMGDVCTLFAPNAPDLAKLLELAKTVDGWDKDLRDGYKKAHGKISVPRSLTIQLNVTQISHVACTRISFGGDTVCVIPWEVLGLLNYRELQNSVRYHLAKNTRYKTITQGIDKKLDPSDNDFWSKLP